MIPRLTVGLVLVLLASGSRGPWLQGASVPSQAGGVILRHLDVSDVEVALRPTGAAVPPSGAGSASRAFWVAAGRRGEYREVPTVLVGRTGSFRVWAQDSIDMPADLMLAAVAQVESSMHSGLLGALLESALRSRRDLFPVDVIYATLSAMGGYFSSLDQPGFRDHPYSNETNAIYISLASCNLSSGCSAPLVAHELQHLLQFVVDPQEETWFNEGLSELAEGSVSEAPLECSDFPLFGWSPDPQLTGLHYRSAASFLSYWQGVLGEEALLSVAVDPSPGSEALRHYLRLTGDSRSLDDLFVQWSLAQALARLSQEEEWASQGPCKTASVHVLSENAALSDTVSQYGCDLVVLTGAADAELKFEGEVRAAVVPEFPPGHDHVWWSDNRSNTHTTLTAELDLRGAQSPHLRYWVWYDIEQWYDWAYAAVSADEGRTWQWLRASGMTAKDPFGNSPGVGYTGSSRRWRMQELDLTPYAGERLLLRFGYLTDDAIESTGFALGGAVLTDPGSGSAATAVEWESQGFVLLSARALPHQRYAIVAIEGPTEEDTRSLPLHGHNRGRWLLPAGETRAVMVCALTAGALPAPYQVEVSYVEPVGGGQMRATPERLADR